ncbi:MAG: hypothetical protein K6G20_06395, partial [Ruminococcus sp.]|nr:hypothetical protein [Ruminococcus sp.]
AKDTIRSVPNMGMGYGFVEHNSTPDICFNYLGEFNEASMKNVGQYSMGLQIAKNNYTFDKIIVNGQILNGKLSFVIICYKEYGKKFAEKLKINLEESVGKLVDYCINVTERTKTSSDIIANQLDESEVDFLNMLFN